MLWDNLEGWGGMGGWGGIQEGGDICIPETVNFGKLIRSPSLKPH